MRESDEREGGMRVGGRRAAIHQNGRLNRLFLTRRPHSVPLHLAQRQRSDGPLGAALCQSFRSFRSGKTATKERAGEHSVGKRCRLREVKTKLLGLCRWSCRDGRPCEGILDLQRTSATTDRMAGFQGGGGALTTTFCPSFPEHILVGQCGGDSGESSLFPQSHHPVRPVPSLSPLF